jgi:hypothetical protein
LVYLFEVHQHYLQKKNSLNLYLLKKPSTNMKKIAPFLFLLPCCPLVACHQHTAEGITYVTEEEPLAYPNHHYLPLLDIIQQFKDFHKERMTTKKNPFLSRLGEEEAANRWDEFNTMYNKTMRRFISDLERHVLDLISDTTTINDYLAKLANIQDAEFSTSAHLAAKHLLDIKTDVGDIVLPTSKKLLGFLMEDKKEFGGHEDSNERSRLRAVTRFEMLNQLTQTAIDLTDRNELDEKSTILLHRIQLTAACEHPNAVGIPYALLERLIFGYDLSRKQKEHCMELKCLLKFDQIREKHPGNLKFISQLFKALYNTTDPTVTLHFLQLIKDMPIKVWFLNSVQKPEGMQYEVDEWENTRITSPLEPILQKLAREKTPQENSSPDAWLAYIQGPATKKGKHQQPSLATTSQKKKRQPHKTIKTSLQPIQVSTKVQEKPTKKQAQKPKKPILSTSSIHDSLEGSIIPIAASPLNEKHTPTIPLQPIPIIIKPALPSLPTIEEATDTDISPTPTTQAASSNTSLTLPTIEEEPMMDHLEPTKQSLPLSSPSKLAKKQPPITIIIKPAAKQVIEPEKAPQEAEEKAQQKEPSKKANVSSSLENSSPISQPAPPQNTIRATPQHRFIMPQGLRSFHAEQLQAAHPLIPFRKHQATINQLFEPATQCNTTYKVFGTLWIANGGDIKHKDGSHCTLQFPQGTNLFGIYKPHGSSATYRKQAIRYLQAATLYIGLRPTNWS